MKLVLENDIIFSIENNPQQTIQNTTMSRYYEG